MDCEIIAPSGESVSENTELSTHRPQGGFAPGHPWRFKPGQSGNPGGIPKNGGKKRIREREKDIIDAHFDLLDNAESEQVRAVVADRLLQWIWGKPGNATQEGSEAQQTLADLVDRIRNTRDDPVYTPALEHKPSDGD